MWFVLPEDKLEIQFPRTRRDLLMLFASMNVSPLDPVLFVFSLPAKSTRQIFNKKIRFTQVSWGEKLFTFPSLLMYPFGSSGSLVSEDKLMVKRECDLDEVAFISCERTDLFFNPSFSTPSKSFKSSHSTLFHMNCYYQCKSIVNLP